MFVIIFRSIWAIVTVSCPFLDHIILVSQGMLESIGFEVIAANPHDHPFSDGFAMPGGETYNIDDFTEVEDVQVSSSEHPRALGILARRL